MIAVQHSLSALFPCRMRAGFVPTPAGHESLVMVKSACKGDPLGPLAAVGGSPRRWRCKSVRRHHGPDYGKRKMVEDEAARRSAREQLQRSVASCDKTLPPSSGRRHGISSICASVRGQSHTLPTLQCSKRASPIEPGHPNEGPLTASKGWFQPLTVPFCLSG